MGQVIATVNMKGGVGKTTLTVNLATCLAKHYQKRVLVVDLDTQISASLSLMSPPDFAKRRKDKRTLRYLVNRVIKPDNPIKNQPILTIHDVIQPYIGNVKGLDLLPGDIELYDEYLVSEMLHQKALREGQSDFEQVWNSFENILVRKVLQPAIKDYDYIILDCAPGYNLLTRSGIIASDYYILPAKPEPLSLIGIQLLERRIKKLKESHELNVPVTTQLMGIAFITSGGLLAGRYYRQVMQRVIEDFSPAQIFRTQIPIDVNVSKAVDNFLPVVLTNPNTAGAKAFLQLTQEFLRKQEILVGAKEQKTKLSLAELE